MPENKHYVYSARTTERGLALINKAKGDKSWDEFINDAVAAHYKLDIKVIGLPPSKFLAEQAAKREKREADKAAKKAEREAKAKAKATEKKAKEKKAAKKTAKEAKGNAQKTERNAQPA